MARQPPTWLRASMGGKRAGARLLHRSQVVIFSFVAFERRRQILVHRNGGHAAAASDADATDSVIRKIKNDHERNQHPCDLCGNPAHGWNFTASSGGVDRSRYRCNDKVFTIQSG